jgi:hypothetical protein
VRRFSQKKTIKTQQWLTAAHPSDHGANHCRKLFLRYSFYDGLAVGGVPGAGCAELLGAIEQNLYCSEVHLGASVIAYVIPHHHQTSAQGCRLASLRSKAGLGRVTQVLETY